jgi:hypothetical protein
MYWLVSKRRAYSRDTYVSEPGISSNTTGAPVEGVTIAVSHWKESDKVCTKA